MEGRTEKIKWDTASGIWSFGIFFELFNQLRDYLETISIFDFQFVMCCFLSQREDSIPAQNLFKLILFLQKIMS